jgi:arylsulfatase
MSDPRSVVLVTVDSLRADYCGFMGADRDLTPAMDRHASDGLVFEHAVTPGPSTLDAMPGIVTGEDLPDSDGDDPIRDRVARHVDANYTLAERFADRGYETAAFTANPWTSRGFGFDAGFDHFEDFLAGAESDGDGTDGTSETADRGDQDSDGGFSLPTTLNLVKRWAGESSMFQAWGSFYDDALAWVESTDGPYFLWLFLVDVHMPYLPVGDRSQSVPETYAANLWLYLRGHEGGLLEPAIRPRLLRAYEDTIRYTDDTFERFLADLDDPLVAVHADHGEAFGEGGVYGHGPTLSEEQVHVPLFVANGPTGRVSNPFSLRRLPEFLPALAAHDGDELPADLLDEVTGPYATTRNRDPTFAVRGRDWKFVDDEGDPHLYELGADGETRLENQDLAAVGEDVVNGWRGHERERQRLVEAIEETVAEEAF